GYIDEHYAESLTLAEAAGKFGYAPNYFSSLFKRYFRIGFAQYVNSVRVRKSIPLLKTQKASSVCYDCGFRSPQQYFLNFRKVFGCTPYEYLHDKHTG
ncbi:MAG: AraC family transcriptional regulator, partial [Clostridia bacterium]|nr:AraC family transcriptional regulator [Clostridia bacterium]